MQRRGKAQTQALGHGMTQETTGMAQGDQRFPVGLIFPNEDENLGIGAILRHLHPTHRDGLQPWIGNASQQLLTDGAMDGLLQSGQAYLMHQAAPGCSTMRSKTSISSPARTSS